MGGRISGESPREEKIAGLVATGSDGRSNQMRANGDTIAPTVERQRSRQQLVACWPFGQHEFRDASDWETEVV
jgi:hypothetical protein